MTERAAWLERRRGGLGGSDVAAALGLDRYRSPLEVWAEKRGELPPRTESDAMRWGARLEPVIADAYAEREQVDLVLPIQENLPLCHATRSWHRGSPDRLVRSERRGVEIKAVGYRMAVEWGDEGSDEVPERYLVQCAWYLALLDYERWDLAALIGGQDLRVYRITRDLELEGLVLERAERFWHDHVIGGARPEIGGSDGDVLKRLHPRPRLPLAHAPAELDPIAAELVSARAHLVTLEEHRDVLEARIKAEIGDREGLVGVGWRATWRRTNDREDFDARAALAAGAIPAEVMRRFTVPREGARRFVFTKEESRG